MLGTISLSLGVGLALEVVGETSCPRAAEVERRVRDLVSEADAPAWRALIRGDGQQVHLAVVDAAGATLAARTLPAERDCAALADALAVIVATWAREPARFQVGLPPPAVTARAAPPRQPLEATLAAAAGAGWSGGAVRPAGALSLVLRPAARWLGVRLALDGAGDRALRLPGGRARFRRVTGSAALAARVPLGPLHGEAWAGAGGGWLALRGEGFARNERSDGAQLAVLAGLAASRSVGRWRPFVALSSLTWPVRAYALQVNTGDDAPLPRHELSLCAGLGFSF